MLSNRINRIERRKEGGNLWGTIEEDEHALSSYCASSQILAFFTRFGIWVLLNWWVWCESQTGSWILAELGWVSGLNSVRRGFWFFCLVDGGCDFAELNLWISILCRILNLWGLSNSPNKVRFLLYPVGVSICISIHSVFRETTDGFWRCFEIRYLHFIMWPGIFILNTGFNFMICSF